VCMALSVTWAASTAATSAGAARRTSAPTGQAKATLEDPAGIALDGNTLYIADITGRALRRLDLSTRHLTTVTREPLQSPSDVSVAPDHTIVVLDGDRIIRVAPSDGRVTVIATRDAIVKAGPGIRGITTAVAADPRGGVFAAGHDHIVHIDPAGVITQIAAGREAGTAGDGGPASRAVFAEIADIVSDRDGHLYVAQSGPFGGDNRIRRIDGATGVVTTIVGPETTPGGSRLAQQRISRPGSLSLDGRGGLVFCDVARLVRVDLASGEVSVVGRDGLTNENWAGAVIAPADGVIISDFVMRRIRRFEPTSGRMTVLAGRGRPRPIIRHGEGFYPGPASEVCTNAAGDAVLMVLAEDMQGGAIPGTTVLLTPIAGASTLEGARRQVTGLTGDSGEAVLRVRTSDDYAVLAVTAGFLPATQAVRLSAGCTGRLRLRLPVAPIQ
jgi:sugar lactone lactonase YvrE